MVVRRRVRPPSPTSWLTCLAVAPTARNSWDNAAIRDLLLVPLGPGGSRRYRTAVMDLPGPAAIDGSVRTSPDDAVLLADGPFLQRMELDPHWDLRVYIDVSFEEVLRRGIARDQRGMGSAAEAAPRYQ